MNETFSQFTEKIKGQLINKQIPEIEQIINNIRSISMLDDLLNSVVWIIDYRTQEYLFISDNSIDIQGYTKDELIELGPLKYMELIPEEDANIITNIIYPEGKKAQKNIPKIFLKNFKVSFTHRLKLKNGAIIKLKKQFTTLLFDKNKNSLVIMGTTSKFEAESNDIVSEVFYKGPFNQLISVHKKKHSVIGENISTLSDKELEIIKLVSEGLSSKEIAFKTNKSVETINTQRKNILSKTNKQSITDVVVMAIKNKWI